MKNGLLGWVAWVVSISAALAGIVLISLSPPHTNTVADGLTKTYALDVVDSIVSVIASTNESDKKVFSASLSIKGAEPSTASVLGVLAYPQGCKNPLPDITVGTVQVGTTFTAHDLQSDDVSKESHIFRIVFQKTELVKMEKVNVSECVQKPIIVEHKIEKDLKLDVNNPELLGFYEDSKGLVHEVKVMATAK